MSANGDPSRWREPFPESEIPYILAAVLRCMAGGKKNSPQEGENVISIRLWKRLRRDAVLRQRPIVADSEAWEIDENQPDGTIGRLDIRFIFSTGIQHPWPIFAIEAKRLHVTFKSGWKSLVSEYVTADTVKPVDKEQGMMCFVTGRYSHGLRAGAMLGYVFDADVGGARDAIAKSISTHAEKLKVCAGKYFLPGSALRESPRQSGIYESHHELPAPLMPASPKGKGDFTIFHILVAV